MNDQPPPSPDVIHAVATDTVTALRDAAEKLPHDAVNLRRTADAALDVFIGMLQVCAWAAVAEARRILGWLQQPLADTVEGIAIYPRPGAPPEVAEDTTSQL